MRGGEEGFHLEERIGKLVLPLFWYSSPPGYSLEKAPNTYYILTTERGHDAAAKGGRWRKVAFSIVKLAFNHVLLSGMPIK